MPRTFIVRSNHRQHADKGHPLPSYAMLEPEPRVSLHGGNFASQHCIGGGCKGLHAARARAASTGSFCFEHFTGKVFSIHSSPQATMQALYELRGHGVFAHED